MDCATPRNGYVRGVDEGVRKTCYLDSGGIEMTRDELNRELRMHSASWPAVLIVYGIIVGTMILSAMAIT